MICSRVGRYREFLTSKTILFEKCMNKSNDILYKLAEKPLGEKKETTLLSI